jgi:hypothetical protein
MALAIPSLMSNRTHSIVALGLLLAAGSAHAALREVSFKTTVKKGGGQVTLEAGKKIGLRVRPGQVVTNEAQKALKTAPSENSRRVLYVVKEPGKYRADLGGKLGNQEIEVLAAPAVQSAETGTTAKAAGKAKRAKAEKPAAEKPAAEAAFREVSARKLTGRTVVLKKGETRIGIRVKTSQSIVARGEGKAPETAKSKKADRIVYVLSEGKYLADLGNGVQKIDVISAKKAEKRAAKQGRRGGGSDDGPDIRTSREPWRDLHSRLYGK